VRRGEDVAVRGRGFAGMFGGQGEVILTTDGHRCTRILKIFDANSGDLIRVGSRLFHLWFNVLPAFPGRPIREILDKHHSPHL
jgi:hypothetical protein